MGLVLIRTIVWVPGAAGTFASKKALDFAATCQKHLIFRTAAGEVFGKHPIDGKQERQVTKDR